MKHAYITLLLLVCSAPIAAQEVLTQTEFDPACRAGVAEVEGMESTDSFPRAMCNCLYRMTAIASGSNPIKKDDRLQAGLEIAEKMCRNEKSNGSPEFIAKWKNRR